MFEIRLAANQDELEQLYRFRYSIYVEEMHRVQHDADHVNKRITDVLDENGYNLLAFKNKEIVGAVRINFTRIGTIPYYMEFYRILEQSGATTENSCIVTRLMISQFLRKSTLAMRINIAAYDFSVSRDIHYGFIDCNDHLVNFFKSFGWHHYIGTSKHKEYGEVHPLKLDLYDEELFRNINSPFLQPLLTWKNQATPPKEEIHIKKIFLQNPHENKTSKPTNFSERVSCQSPASPSLLSQAC